MIFILQKGLGIQDGSDTAQAGDESPYVRSRIPPNPSQLAEVKTPSGAYVYYQRKGRGPGYIPWAPRFTILTR